MRCVINFLAMSNISRSFYGSWIMTKPWFSYGLCAAVTSLFRGATASSRQYCSIPPCRDAGTGVMTGALPPDLWKGVGQRGHSCPYMTGSLVILGSPKRVKWRGIAPCPFERGQQERKCIFVPESQAILWFIKIDLKQIYCSYLRTHKSRNSFL